MSLKPLETTRIPIEDAVARLHLVSPKTLATKGISRRFQNEIEKFLQGLSEALEFEPTPKTKFTLRAIDDQIEFDEGVSRLCRRSGVVVELRVFEQPLALVFGEEFVHELACVFSKRQSDNVLKVPGEKQIAALKFVISKVLSNTDLFSGQRVLLVSVERLNTARASSRIGSYQQSALTLVINTQFGSSQFSVLAALSGELQNQTALRASLQVPDEEAQVALRNAETNWGLSCKLRVGSIQKLLDFRAGDRIALRGGSWRLSAHRGSALSQLELLTNSMLGGFCFRLLSRR